jgi:replication factor C subunit 3/5
MARNRSVEAKKKFKVLVLHEVDSLSKQAQHSLRRTMEKYSSVCRIVMLCSTVSKVLEPVRSRCMCIRVAAPPDTKIMDTLMHVSQEEQLNLPVELASRIVSMCGRDLRKALLCLECCRVEHFPFLASQQPRLADWELYIAVCSLPFCVEVQAPQRLQSLSIFENLRRSGFSGL